MIVRSGVHSPTKNSQNGTNTKLRLNNACIAELGWYPLIINIQKRAVKFYNHLKGSDSQTFQNKAITYKEMNLEKSLQSKLVLGLYSRIDLTEPQDRNTIRPNQIMRKQKYSYLTSWKELTKKTEQTRMLFGPKQRVHSGRLPDHCDWPKIKESFDYVHTPRAWTIERSRRR